MDLKFEGFMSATRVQREDMAELRRMFQSFMGTGKLTDGGSLSNSQSALDHDQSTLLHVEKALSKSAFTAGTELVKAGAVPPIHTSEAAAVEAQGKKVEDRITTKKAPVVISDSGSEPIVKDALAKEPQAQLGKWKVVESDPKPVDPNPLVPTPATVKDGVEDSTAASKGHSSAPSGEDSGSVGSGNAQSDVREEIAEVVAAGAEGEGDQLGQVDVAEAGVHAIHEGVQASAPTQLRKSSRIPKSPGKDKAASAAHDSASLEVMPPRLVAAVFHGPKPVGILTTSTPLCWARNGRGRYERKG